MSGNEIKLFLKHRNPASKSWDWHEVRDWEVRLEFSHTTPPNTHSVLTDADGEEID